MNTVHSGGCERVNVSGTGEQSADAIFRQQIVLPAQLTVTDVTIHEMNPEEKDAAACHN
jgi:hypothetical protein